MKETAATGWHAIHGDALLSLRDMRGAGFAAIITDPPYASGGMSMAERSRSTRDKYTSYGEQGNPYPDFSGDALAQRAWTNFFHEIMVAALAAIGLNTDFREMQKAGLRPMLHGFIISALVVVVALLVEMAMGLV